MAVPKEEKAIRPDAVAIYVRWSTEEQGEGTTLQEQLERCKSYVVSQGWRVNDSLIFIDEGYSGATLHRPAIGQLRGLIKRGQIDCVVSLKLDRLSRSLVDCVDLVLREWTGICHYKSVSQPVNTTDELSRVFFAILAGFAEYERALIRERTFSGLLRRVQEGNFWGAGKAPFGYSRVAKGKIAVNPQESGVVRMIFEMAAGDGIGPAAIATRLNESGIPGPEGKGWWTYTVRQMLRNRTYLGFLEYGKRYVDQHEKAGGRRVLRQRERPLVVPGQRIAELALVSQEEFDAAQRVLDALSERAHTKGAGAKSSHLLTGTAVCRCGGSLITGYDALKRRHYFCQNRDSSRGGKGCTSGGGLVYAHQIEPVVAEEVKRRFTDLEAVTQDVRRRWQVERDQGTQSAQTYQALIVDLGRKGHRLEEDLARVLRQARRGEITLTEKRAFEQDIEAERQELAEQRAAIERSLSGLEDSEAELQDLLTWLARVDQWDELPTETQKELLRRLVERLVIYKPKGRGKVPEVDFFWRV